MFEWVKGNVYTQVLTLSPTNITLNSSAAAHFQEVRWVMVGIDKEHYQLGIRPISKRELDLKLVPLSQVHKISVGKSYARISNKTMIDEVSAMVMEPIDGQKVHAIFDETQNMLVADFHELNVCKG